jgi:hypothetical protein
MLYLLITEMLELAASELFGAHGMPSYQIGMQHIEHAVCRQGLKLMEFFDYIR